MAITVDNLQIEIQSNANNASNSIKSLSSALERLKTICNGGIGLGVVAREVKALSRTSELKASNTVKNVTKAVKSGVKSVQEEIKKAESGGSTFEGVKSSLDWGSSLEKTKKAVDANAKSVKQLSKATKDATSKFGQMFNSLKRIAMYRLIRSAMKAITSAMKEGLSNAYQFSRDFGSSSQGLATALDKVSSASLKMKNQLGSAFGGLLQALSPIIIKLADLVTGLANRISRIFAMVNGDKTYLVAKDVSTSWEDATDSVKGYANELKQLQGFDELNNLSTSKDSGSGSTTSPSIQDMFEEVDTNASTGSALRDFLDQLTSTAVKGAIDALEGLVTMINGGIDGDWNEFFSGAEKFASSPLGSMGGWYGGFMDWFNENYEGGYEKLKQDAHDWWAGLWTEENIPTTLFGKPFAVGLDKVKEMFSEENLPKTLFGKPFLEGWNRVKEIWKGSKVKSFFEKIWSKIKSNFEGKSGTEVFFGNAFLTGWNKVKEIWSKSKVKSWFEDVWEKIKSNFRGKNGTQLFFGDAFLTGWEAVKTAWDGSKIKSFFEEVWEKIKSVFSGVKTFFSNLWDSIWDTSNSDSSGYGKEYTIADIQNGDATVGWNNSSIHTENHGIVGNSNKTVTGSTNLAGLDTSKIKKYASGGVPSRGTLFYAGENGAEFVGSMGSSSAVANSGQMAEAIEQASYRGMARALQENGGADGYEVIWDSQKVFGVMRKEASNYTKRTGNVAFS